MTAELSRQAFVRGALGVAAAAVLGSCASPPAAPGSGTPTPSPSPSGSGPPRWADLGDLAVLPSDPTYGSAKTVFNTRFSGSTPVAVVICRSVADVQRALAFAAANDVQVTSRSGGHSYVGASTASGTMVLDLRRLGGPITYDAAAATATVPAAADIDSVQRTLSPLGRSIPTGSCPSVGLAGLALGGGLGADARSHGLTCDAMTSATVVLPGGEVVTASAAEDADLFWALRGGGANWGVVTSFTFTTYPTTDRDVVTLAFDGDATAEVLVGWHRWLTAADHGVWGMVNVTVGPDPTRCSVVLATPPGAGPSLADDVVAAIGAPEISRTIRTFDRPAFVAYFGGGPDAVRPRAFVAGTDVVSQMTPVTAAALVAATSAWPRDLVPATMVVESLGGAIQDVAPDATAFPWRRHAASVQWYVETPTTPLVDAAAGWLTAAHGTLGDHSAGGYVNYLEQSSPAQRYFDSNLVRLRTLRQRYDPGRLMWSSFDW
ncbi:FAD-binding oxidoreductase [Mycobacterium yunnanensis]|uniref:FAD-binding oxidoreductase n=1 Tax=Mycobacterium yunnanensis TaxID=368477 RepID=A0A9X3BZQ4_9MYCO|nr:FAD-binding oxidoreductase [Mycobacterium yunnanensis]MCV7420023.1 FAD-binding oxidoreductase [Mycobacterium yunnanensis]